MNSYTNYVTFYRLCYDFVSLLGFIGCIKYLYLYFIYSTMGGHGHGPPYTIPPYTQFSHKGIPQLEELEKALAAKGLRDPWIRYVQILLYII